MSSYEMQNTMGALVGLMLVYAVVAIGVYVWYALALSKVFPKLGAEGWKAWVPVLNEAEILVRGGVPAWSVIYYFIPILQLYGLYLKFTALNRINPQFGYSTGMSVLGVLLSPVWASILAWGKPRTAPVYDERVASMMPSGSAVTGPLAGPAATPEAAPMPTFGVPAAAAPAAPVYGIPGPVDAPPAAPTSVPAADAPAATPMISNPWAPATAAAAPTPEVAVPPAIVPPVYVPPVTVAPPVAVEPPVTVTPPPVVVEPPAAVEPPVGVAPAETVAPPRIISPPEGIPPLIEPLAEPAPAISPAPVAAPASAPATEFPVLPTAPEPVVEAAPEPAPTPEPEPTPEPTPAPAPVVFAPAHSEAADRTIPIEELLRAQAEAAAAEAAAAAAAEDDDDEFAATIVVNRAPRIVWKLQLDDGRSFDLVEERVELGRKPDGTTPGTQYLAIADQTRTLSKSHARLELADGQWSVTDLNSTNGVLTADAADVETLLDAGGTARVTDRFILGKVGMRLSFSEDAQS